MIKNIFITGRSGCGKTTLIMQIIKKLNLNIGGFYTAEIRERGQRKGFKIIDLGGKEGVLADIDLKSPYKVGKYKVNLKDLEEIGVKSILNAISKNKVLGTIKLAKDPFTEKIKNRKDTRIFHLTESNFKQIKTEIIKILRPSA